MTACDPYLQPSRKDLLRYVRTGGATGGDGDVGPFDFAAGGFDDGDEECDLGGVSGQLRGGRRGRSELGPFLFQPIWWRARRCRFQMPFWLLEDVQLLDVVVGMEMI